MDVPKINGVRLMTPAQRAVILRGEPNMKIALQSGYTIHISEGNSKLGKIPNFNLTPGRTCSAQACKTCFCDGCYARNSVERFDDTAAAWHENTEAVLHDLPGVEAALMKYFGRLSAPRFFRVHSGGDFVTAEYAAMWARVAAANPGTHFLAFTKQFSNVAAIEFPSSFSLVPSAWPGIEIPAELRARYSVAWLYDGTNADEIPVDAVECPGNCDTCGVCWSLARRGLDVVFTKHGSKAKRNIPTLDEARAQRV